MEQLFNNMAIVVKKILNDYEKKQRKTFRNVLIGILGIALVFTLYACATNAPLCGE